MKYLIVGGVAAGTKVAAKLKRCDRSAEVLVVTKSEDISYAGCGLPYYIGGDIKTRAELIVNTPAAYEGLTGVSVRTGCEAVALDASAHEVTVREKDGTTHAEGYDRLVIATGASPLVPAGLPGADLPGVFTVRTPNDAEAIRGHVEAGARRAVVVGAGFIGLEVAENLLARGLSVTVVDALPQILPNVFDPEMADFARRQLKAAGVRVVNGATLTGITGDGRVEAVETSAGSFPADLVILSIGIRPNTGWLEGSGIETIKGCVLVDEYAATNLPDVYAAGDCTVSVDMLDGSNKIIALWPNAVYQGMAAGSHMAGGDLETGGAYSVNAIDFYGLRICTCGLINATGAQYSDRVKTDGNAYKRLIFEGTRLVGFVLINSSENAGIYTDLIAKKVDLSTLEGDIMETPSLFLFDRKTRTQKLTGGIAL